MKFITANPDLVAFCGLYCGACHTYLKEKCPGCHKNDKASWCKIRSCCIEHNYSSCAECVDYTNVPDCKKFNNFISKIIGVLLRSDRFACIAQIKKMGIHKHAESMAENRRHTIRK